MVLGAPEFELNQVGEEDDVPAQFQSSATSGMFQGFKPGENVKISEILKRDSSILNSSAAGSFLMDQSLTGLANTSG
jgi:hypothetical protein